MWFSEFGCNFDKHDQFFIESMLKGIVNGSERFLKSYLVNNLLQRTVVFFFQIYLAAIFDKYEKYLIR